MIVIPMAGRSTRFKKEGYNGEKYWLPIGEKLLLQRVMDSFSNLKKSDVLFALGNHNRNDKKQILSMAKDYFLGNIEVQILKRESIGQADTVFQALSQSENISDTPMIIFNVDTLRPNLHCSRYISGQNCIEVVKLPGDHWSFVQPHQNIPNRVVHIAEKFRISELCCSGAYTFASTKLYQNLFELTMNERASLNISGEFFVSEVIQAAINSGIEFFFEEISSSEIFLCGIPSEYENFPLERYLESINSR